MGFTLDLPAIESAKGTKQYSFELTAGWLAEALGDTELSPVEGAHAAEVIGTLDVDASKTGPDVLISARVRLRMASACVRCTEPVPLEFTEPFTRLLSPKAELEAELELSADDLDVDWFAGETIDVEPYLREHLLLESPSHPVCEEGCADPSVAAILGREREPLAAKASPFAALAGLSVDDDDPKTKKKD